MDEKRFGGAKCTSKRGLINGGDVAFYFIFLIGAFVLLFSSGFDLLIIIIWQRPICPKLLRLQKYGYISRVQYSFTFLVWVPNVMKSESNEPSDPSERYTRKEYCRDRNSASNYGSSAGKKKPNSWGIWTWRAYINHPSKWCQSLGSIPHFEIYRRSNELR